jgi:hypothetical protein
MFLKKFDKENILISRDTNYTLMAVRMHTTEKEKKKTKKIKSPATVFRPWQQQYNHHQDNT